MPEIRPDRDISAWGQDTQTVVAAVDRGLLLQFVTAVMEVPTVVMADMAHTLP